MSMLSAPIRSIVEKVGIDPDRVGRVFATGSQCQVHEFSSDNGQNQVLKIPTRQFRKTYATWISHAMGGQDLRSAEEELKLGREYFEPYLVDTTIHSDRESQQFVVTQPRIETVRITEEIVRTNDKVRSQLADIMRRNSQIIHEKGRWLDSMGCDAKRLLEFMGPEGTPYFENLVLDGQSGNVRLLEAAFYSFSLRHRLLYMFQHENARRFGLSFDEHTSNAQLHPRLHINPDLLPVA